MIALDEQKRRGCIDTITQAYNDLVCDKILPSEMKSIVKKTLQDIGMHGAGKVEHDRAKRLQHAIIEYRLLRIDAWMRGERVPPLPPLDRMFTSDPFDKKNGQIYFIRNGDLVKIGFSINPKARLRDLQTSNGNTLELLHVTSGTRSDEASLHRRFKAHRRIGEWFDAKPVIDYLGELNGDLEGREREGTA